jgi:hypothetical protein
MWTQQWFDEKRINPWPAETLLASSLKRDREWRLIVFAASVCRRVCLQAEGQSVTQDYTRRAAASDLSRLLQIKRACDEVSKLHYW